MAYGAGSFFFGGDFPYMVFGFAYVAVGLILFGIGCGASEIIEPIVDERERQKAMLSPAERAAKQAKVKQWTLICFAVALVLIALLAPFAKIYSWVVGNQDEFMIAVIGGGLYLMFMIACAILAAGCLRRMGIR